MIPLTSENEWCHFLTKLPFKLPFFSKTVILAPHPDDETLGAGGLIADLRLKNLDVLVIAITDGENAYHHFDNLREIRKKEQEKALKNLGVSKEKIIRLYLVDSSVELIEHKLEELIFPFINKEVHLVAPWIGDFHPDHAAVGRVATRIASLTGAILSYYFFWTWHHGTFATINELPLFRYPLSLNSFNLKQKALSCYTSQRHYSEPILPPLLLKPAKRPFEVYCHEFF